VIVVEEKTSGPGRTCYFAKGLAQAAEANKSRFCFMKVSSSARKRHLSGNSQLATRAGYYQEPLGYEEWAWHVRC
jgi:hypothetical protein